MSEPIHIISLGAGVQSSTMALMAARGEITPMPVAAIFADTMSEPDSVYAWLDWLEKQLPFPVFRVSRGSLEAEALVMRKSKKGLAYSRTDIPFFTRAQDGTLGKISNRSCTADYKIKPIMSKAREIVGSGLKLWRRGHRQDLLDFAQYKHAVALAKRNQKLGLSGSRPPNFPGKVWESLQGDAPVIQWIGISLDEVQRMKPSRDPWAVARWPLIEMRKRRHDCLLWMERNGYPEPPRSACVFCPFHDNAEWRRLRDNEPVQFERAVQSSKARSENIESVPYLHRSCVPLDQVDLSTDFERGQGSLWGNECEGMCGV